jgi:hypothetical protein
VYASASVVVLVANGMGASFLSYHAAKWRFYASSTLEMHFINAGPRAARGETFHERHHAFECWKALIRFLTRK